MKKQPAEILAQVNHLSVGDKSTELYNDWSANYDEDLVNEFGYISPRVAAETLAKETANRDLRIIDYGCGTGLVGEALKSERFGNIDGFDISDGMLEQARAKQVYTQLMQGDLTTAIAFDDECYDAGFCIGSMGAGHVGAEHVLEMLRPIKSGGYMIIIINGIHYAPEGFEQKFRQLEDDGHWQIQQLREFNYMSELIRPGWLLVANKP
jgi:ubiquinone/menaquinone biosynthesis C-methylase UbiE